MKFFEDVPVGNRMELGSFTFTAENIKEFARQFDPQPFHLDEAAGKASLFGGLAASGWHTTAVFMKLNVAARAKLAADNPDATWAGGPAMGFRDLKWIRPVMAGDTLTYSTVVLDKRESGSKPEWGILVFENSAVNQRNEPALSFVATAFMLKRPKK